MNVLINTFDRQFGSLHSRSRSFIEAVPQELLYRKPREMYAMFSAGEYILRSAAMIEQTFGGLTTRLWDDPFEWTLPEKLASNADVLNYLDEVDETRRHGLAFLTSDSDLAKEVPSPEKLRTIFEILLDTVAKAEHFQGRAFAVFQMLSDAKLPRP